MHAWRCFSDLRSAGFSSSQATIAILLQKRCIGAKSSLCVCVSFLQSSLYIMYVDIQKRYDFFVYVALIHWIYCVIFLLQFPIHENCPCVLFLLEHLGRAEIVHPIQNLHPWLVKLLQPFWEVLHSKAPSRLTYLLVESNV